MQSKPHSRPSAARRSRWRESGTGEWAAAVGVAPGVAAARAVDDGVVAGVCAAAGNASDDGTAAVVCAAAGEVSVSSSRTGSAPRCGAPRTVSGGGVMGADGVGFEPTRPFWSPHALQAVENSPNNGRMPENLGGVRKLPGTLPIKRQETTPNGNRNGHRYVARRGGHRLRCRETHPILLP